MFWDDPEREVLVPEGLSGQAKEEILESLERLRGLARLAREIVTLFNQGRPDLSKSPIRVRIIVVHDDNGKPYYYIQRMGW